MNKINVEKVIDYSNILKENERLTENNLSMQGEMARTWKKEEEKDKEIERLNNIINEIEKFMDEDYEYYEKYGSAEQGHAMGQICRFRNKMKELKGVDKECK